MKPSTGKSKRTPAKHDLMSKLYGREVGVANAKPEIDDLVWLDLTAGDGLPSEPDREWIRSCSPGILAYLARFPHGKGGPPQASKPTRVVLHERAARTYETLLGNLAENLPALGYHRTSDNEWRCGCVELTALNIDGATADLSTIGRRTAVMISNDPNAIVDWAMPAAMPEAIRGRTLWHLGISTMGCNPAGLKRLDWEQRQGWYDHIGSQIGALRRHHDLFLAAIERDDAQWAYLITAPATWRAETESLAATAFAKHGMSLQTAWWRTESIKFRGMADVLFKTKQERGGAVA